MMDIDFFQAFNDNHGYDVGDLILRETAHAIKKEIRACDTASRIGSEEFLVLCVGANTAMAADAAERIRLVIESNNIEHKGQMLRATINVRVSERNQRTQSADDLLKMADEAMYIAKRAGRNRICIAQDNPVPYSSQQAPSSIGTGGS